jgi:hypothetical protein
MRDCVPLKFFWSPKEIKNIKWRVVNSFQLQNIKCINVRAKQIKLRYLKYPQALLSNILENILHQERKSIIYSATIVPLWYFCSFNVDTNKILLTLSLSNLARNFAAEMRARNLQHRAAVLNPSGGTCNLIRRHVTCFLCNVKQR